MVLQEERSFIRFVVNRGSLHCVMTPVFFLLKCGICIIAHVHVMSMSTCTCRVQSDSMQENQMLVAIAKDGNKGRGITIKGGRHGRGHEGMGMRESQS